MSDTDPTATLASLSSSLSTLEGALAPLLAKPLDDHLDGQDPLVQARMQILASYVVHDLIWVYLKTAGVDPATHPVMAEIERLKGYFGKLKAAQSGATAAAEPTAPASRPRMAVDKRAANRFITAAISSSRAAVDPDYTPAGEGEGDAEAGPSGTHIRFDEGEVERLLEDDAAGDEEGAEEAEGALQVGKRARKGKKRESEGGAVEEDEGAKATGKKRKVLDPFAGYDQPKPSPPASSTKNPSTKSSRRRSTVNAEAAAPAADDSFAAGSPAPAGNAGAGLSKSQKKKLARKQQAAAAAAAAVEGAEGKKQ